MKNYIFALICLLFTSLNIFAESINDYLGVWVRTELNPGLPPENDTHEYINILHNGDKYFIAFKYIDSVTGKVHRGNTFQLMPNNENCWSFTVDYDGDGRSVYLFYLIDGFIKSKVENYDKSGRYEGKTPAGNDFFTYTRDW